MSDEELQLLEKIAAAVIKSPQEALPMPISCALWKVKHLAIYMNMSENRVRSDIVTNPTFPRPVRLPCSDRAQAQYEACEVVIWTRSHKSKT